MSSRGPCKPSWRSRRPYHGYLLYVQLGVIGETCDWCLLSDVALSVVTVLALLRLKNAVVLRVPHVRKAPMAAAGEERR